MTALFVQFYQIQKMINPKLTILLILVLGVYTANIITFDEFIAKFNKPYTAGTEEYNQKKAIFDKNVEQLKQQNCQACGVTKFFDVPKSDFEKKTFTLQQPQVPVSSPPLVEEGGLKKLSAPRSIDWRTRGAVTSIKQQGQCGCCWAFATIAMAESSLILKQQATQSIDLSQQYLLKCTPDGDCEGGYIQNAIKQISAYGAPPQSKYPYNPFKSNTGICMNLGNVKVTNSKPLSYYDISAEQIKNLLTRGPIAIAIDSTDWQYYTGGIWKCNPKNDVNHAVLLVGYTQDGKSWIVKNQWGSDWGDNGYIYVSTDSNYNCKIGRAVHMLHGFYAQVLALFMVALFMMM